MMHRARRLTLHPRDIGDFTDPETLGTGLTTLAASRAYLSSAIYLSDKGRHGAARRRYRQAIALARMPL